MASSKNVVHHLLGSLPVSSPAWQLQAVEFPIQILACESNIAREKIEIFHLKLYKIIYLYSILLKAVQMHLDIHILTLNPKSHKSI